MGIPSKHVNILHNLKLARTVQKLWPVFQALFGLVVQRLAFGWAVVVKEPQFVMTFSKILSKYLVVFQNGRFCDFPCTSKHLHDATKTQPELQ